MVGSQYSLINRKGALQERLCLGVAALSQVKAG
jgi:hypothetical protein